MKSKDKTSPPVKSQNDPDAGKASEKAPEPSGITDLDERVAKAFRNKKAA